MLTLLQTLVAGSLRLPKRRVQAEHDDGMIVIELGEGTTGALLLALALLVAALLRVCCSRRDRSVAPLLFGILRAVVAADGVVKPEEERLLADVAAVIAQKHPTLPGLAAAQRRRPATPREAHAADLSPKQAEMVVILMAHLALVDGELHQAEEAVCHDFAQALGLRVQRWVAIMESVAEQHNTAIKLTHGASKKARSHELLVRTHDFYEVLGELIRTET